MRIYLKKITFQEFKKEQFNITQKEIEAKTLEVFRIKEKQEKEILLNKIKENENVFNRMEKEKNELALIKDDFKHANNVYDFHVNKYEELRLSKEEGTNRLRKFHCITDCNSGKCRIFRV